MESNELRIGNFVIDSETNRIGKCVGIWHDNSFEMLFTPNSETHRFSIKPDELIGVPLTEEILLKCGFEIEGDGTGYVYVLHEFGLVILKIGEYYEWDNHDWGRKVLFLHDLQNLFFALKGEELKIDLS